MGFAFVCLSFFSLLDATSSDDDDDETLHEFVELNSNSMKDEVSDVVQQFATIVCPSAYFGLDSVSCLLTG